jgi:hypothetical protein
MIPPYCLGGKTAVNTNISAQPKLIDSALGVVDVMKSMTANRVDPLRQQSLQHSFKLADG